MLRIFGIQQNSKLRLILKQMTTSTNMQLNQTGEVAKIIDCIQNLDLNDFSLNLSRSLVAAYELRKFSKPALMIAFRPAKI